MRLLELHVHYKWQVGLWRMYVAALTVGMPARKVRSCSDHPA